MINVAPLPRPPLVLLAKRGLMTVVLVGVLVSVSALTWRLAMLLPNGSPETVIGPLTSPFGLQTWQP